MNTQLPVKFQVDDVVHCTQVFDTGDVVHVRQTPLDRDVKVVQVPNIGPHATLGHICVEALDDSDGFMHSGIKFKKQWWVSAACCTLVSRDK